MMLAALAVEQQLSDLLLFLSSLLHFDSVPHALHSNELINHFPSYHLVSAVAAEAAALFFLFEQLHLYVVHILTKCYITVITADLIHHIIMAFQSRVAVSVTIARYIPINP